jgi:hypothetical protein
VDGAARRYRAALRRPHPDRRRAAGPYRKVPAEVAERGRLDASATSRCRRRSPSAST